MTDRAAHASRRRAPAARSTSPWLVGVGIGLLNIGAFAALRKGIGVSGAYESTAALAARQLAPDALQVNAFVQARDKAPKFDWESCLVLGMVVGGMLATQAGRAGPARVFEPESEFETDPSTAPAQQQQLQQPPLRSPLASMAGGALLMYGARMADGCTSGHALSGTAQGAASSWVFTPLMFLVGSVVARRLRAVQGER